MEWIDGLKALKKFKDSAGCNRIIAYSDVQYIIQLAKKLGANTDYTFISFD